MSYLGVAYHHAGSFIFYMYQIQDVSSTCTEVHGCTSMYLIQDVSSTCTEVHGCTSMYLIQDVSSTLYL